MLRNSDHTEVVTIWEKKIILQFILTSNNYNLFKEPANIVCDFYVSSSKVWRYQRDNKKP